MSAAFGTLYGLGVGPGDPDLITVKALRILQRVPSVFVPLARSGAPSYARTIVEGYLDPARQQVHELVFAMREDEGPMQRQWHANAQVIAEALQHSDAAFLTEGDPLLYSTFVHVAGALRAVLPAASVIVVPGVSSFQAAAAGLGLSLADRDERVAILPASYEREGLETALRDFDTVILLKVSVALDRVLDALAAAGRLGEAVCVSRAGRPDEAVVHDVAGLRGQRLDYFSLIIVGRRP